MASFEYVVVAACVIGAVGAIFGSGVAGSISAGLTSGIGELVNLITAAFAG